MSQSVIGTFNNALYSIEENPQAAQGWYTATTGAMFLFLINFKKGLVLIGIMCSCNTIHADNTP